jgi:hypothetical protein
MKNIVMLPFSKCKPKHWQASKLSPHSVRLPLSAAACSRLPVEPMAELASFLRQYFLPVESTEILYDCRCTTLPVGSENKLFLYLIVQLINMV